MGIESEQLVFDYLSRIGDLAHSTTMTAAERARLVNEVRADIERRRAEAGGTRTVAGTRRILDRIGRPEEVVASAGASVPPPREARPVGTPKSGRNGRGGKGSPEGAGGARASVPPTAAVPPHLAGTGERGSRQGDSEWWHTSPATRYVEGGRVQVGGFVGGIELPEVLQPPPETGEGGDGQGGEGGRNGRGSAAVGAPDGTAAGAEEAPPAPADPSARRWAARLWRARTARAAGGPRVGGGVELLAAALLVAGAVLGSLIPLGLGWLVAWWSPRLSRQEARWAVMGVPGVVAGTGMVWLWGRTEGRWGEPIAQDALGEAVIAAWPWALRAAAVASALFLVWRARRRPRG